ncbi:hypothetical protein T4E_45 [Trichinella pseudospiralis]|uniref:Uncharacterized protein n=1 Tax=Trichinella pseudospiralis TaxID=6337 RepID=A0A0V0XT00_TRIPS|nr:hypothetical protein T4E_45 [Trichinella pseudospiralis]
MSFFHDAFLVYSLSMAEKLMVHKVMNYNQKLAISLDHNSYTHAGNTLDPSLQVVLEFFNEKVQ